MNIIEHSRGIDIYPFVDDSRTPNGADGRISAIDGKVSINFTFDDLTPANWKIMNEAVEKAFLYTGRQSL